MLDHPRSGPIHPPLQETRSHPKTRASATLDPVKRIAVLVLILATLTACGMSTTPVSQPAPATSAPVTTKAAPADATDPVGLTDDGWKIDSFAMKADGAGNFGATARITNTGAAKQAAAFTVTVMDTSKNVVVVLQGVASSIAKDATVTVQFVSQNPYKTGAYLYAFQVDAL